MTDDAGMSAGARQMIESLSLQPHPEGGWYRETHRSQVAIARAGLPDVYPGDRCALTSILFLLPTGARSRWHRVRSEELWIHQGGDEVRLAYRARMEDTTVHTVRLGRPGEAVAQAAVPAGWWQAAQAQPGEYGYALAACVVAPGFEFEDFELA